MKKIILLVFLLIISKIGEAQVVMCGTPTTHTHAAMSIINGVAQANAVSSGPPYYIELFFHIIQYSNGTSGSNAPITPAFVNTLVDQVNSYYNGSGQIYFVETGFDYIKNDQLATPNSTPAYENSLFATGHINNVLNIYLLPNDVAASPGYFQWGGVAQTIPGNALAVSYSNITLTKTTLSHEIGHCLGLFHTHHGSILNPEGACFENTNESNCTTCGDFICDTPSDPYLNTAGYVNGSTCLYTGPAPYTPLVNNIMSYAPYNCITTFTQGQFTRMEQFLSTSSTVTPYEYVLPVISGNLNFCGSQLFSLNNISPGTSVNWSISPSNNANLVANGNNVTVNRVVDASAVLTATIHFLYGSASVSVVINPSVLSGYYTYGSTTTQMQTFNYVSPGNITGYYNWSGVNSVSLTASGGSGFYTTGGGNFYFTLASGQSINFNYTAKTNCGTTITATRTVLASSGFAIIASPNPASTSIKLSISTVADTTGVIMKSQMLAANASTLLSSTNSTTILLYSATTGALVRRWSFQESTSPDYTLNLSGIGPGLYIIKMSRDNKATSTNIQIH